MWSRARPRRAATLLLAVFICSLGTPALLLPEEAATDPYEPCRDRVRAAPDDWRTYDCFLRVTQRLGDVERGVAELEAVARDSGRALAKGYLATLLQERDPARAEGLLREAAAALGESNRPELEVYQRVALAALLDRQGRADEAGNELERAVAAAVRAGPAQRALAQFEQVRHEVEALEDYGRAYRRLRRLEPEIFPAGSAADQHRWLESMGTVLWYLGRHRLAFEMFQRDAELLRAHGDRAREAVARNNLALLAPSAGLDELEEPLLREALALAAASGNRSAESVACARLSELASGEERERLARRAVELVRGREQLEALAWAVSERDPERALALLDEAEQLARRSGSRSEVARNAYVRSRLLWRIGPRRAAIAASLAALDAAEAARNFQPDSEVRARRFAQWGLLYSELVGHLLAHDEPGGFEEPGSRVVQQTEARREELELAFTVLERHRARSLLDDLDAARSTAMVGVPAARDEYEALLRELNRLQRKLLFGGGSEDEREVLARRIAGLELDVQEQGARLAREDPRYAELRRPELATLREVQEALESEVAVLVYHLAEVRHGGSYVLGILRDRVVVGRLSPEDHLAPKVDLYLGLLRNGARGDAGLVERASSQLYRELFPPAVEAAIAEAEHLVIVPVGPLYGLPFGTLRRSSAGAPLIERVSLTTVPSATAWLRWRRTPARATKRALAFVDPVPVRSGEKGAAPGVVRGWEWGRDLELGALPFARDEGRRLVRSAESGSLLLVGREASESFLRHESVRDFSVVHFGVHAIVDRENPARSALVLAPGAEDEDGLLQMREIVQLDLSGSLVVLASCQSASGAVVGYEGFLGLTYGFFVAGARTVVGSLWPLQDRRAAEVFSIFYRRLTRGDSVAAALTAAQRSQIERGRDVSEWAGLVVLGDGDFVPFPGGVSRWSRRSIWILGGVAASVLALLLWARHRAGWPA